MAIDLYCLLRLFPLIGTVGTGNRCTHPQLLYSCGPCLQAVPVVPFLLTGMTDSRNYAHLSGHGVLRFVPYALHKRAGDLARVHGVDERVREADFHRAICTYMRMLRSFGDTGPGAG